MADYVIPSCDSPSSANIVNGQPFRVVPAGVQNGRGRFAIVKSHSGEGYEEWSVDAQYLRIRSDTTWAHNPVGDLWCDTKCGVNNLGNCQQRWNTDPSSPHNGISPSSPWAYTIYHDPSDPCIGAPWIPRQLKLPVGGSTEYTTNMLISAAELQSCASCWVDITTGSGGAVARNVVAERFASWNGFSDVVHLRIAGGPGAGENYYYARGRGWIGFNGHVSSATVGSDAMPKSSCASFSPASIGSVIGGSSPPSEPPSNPPSEPPSNPGGCPCRSDVDNFCLYPKSETGCGMLQPGGYCDPNGDGSFDDGDWVRGYNEWHSTCK